LLYWLPLATTFAYTETSWDLQRILKQQGWSLVISEPELRTKEKPVFYLACHEASHTVALVIRGTKDISDVLTNINALPERVEVRRPKPAQSEAHLEPGWAGLEDAAAAAEASDLVTAGMAHAGMAKSAKWLKAEVGPALERFYAAKYKVVVAGHSLGAGVASIFTLLEHLQAPPECDMRCIGFATPACTDANLSDYSKAPPPMHPPPPPVWGPGGAVTLLVAQDLIQTTILRDDVVPRASKANILRLLDDLRKFSATTHTELDTDWGAVKTRALNLWEPPRRGAKKESAPSKVKPLALPLTRT
jgi:hypothetical protein